MVIRSNIPSMIAYRWYSYHNDMIARCAERLASGYRINRAADDAAGLAISEKMRAQIRGLNMAAKNSMDALSMVDTAEGALSEAHSILQRMNELAVQAATGTLEDFDRRAAAKEFEQLKRELNDISDQTTFNNMKLLDGSKSYEGAIRSAQTAGVNLTVADNLSPAEGEGDKKYTLEFDFVKLQDGDEISFSIGDNKVSITKEAGETRSAFMNRLQSKVEAAGGTFKDGAVLSSTAAISEATLKYTPQDSNAMRIQCGALENQQLAISIDCMNTAALGLDGINLNDQDSAGRAITAVRNAVLKLADQRTTLGAMHNRLEYKISNLQNQSINLSDAESRIRDVDIAKEMTEFVKHQILAQVATAIMAQMNTRAYNVLTLLGM